MNKVLYFEANEKFAEGKRGRKAAKFNIMYQVEHKDGNLVTRRVGCAADTKEVKTKLEVLLGILPGAQIDVNDKKRLAKVR
jgi:hypothetical protein